jgi:hypothetical protein
VLAAFFSLRALLFLLLSLLCLLPLVIRFLLSLLLLLLRLLLLEFSFLTGFRLLTLLLLLLPLLGLLPLEFSFLTGFRLLALLLLLLPLPLLGLLPLEFSFLTGFRLLALGFAPAGFVALTLLFLLPAILFLSALLVRRGAARHRQRSRGEHHREHDARPNAASEQSRLVAGCRVLRHPSNDRLHVSPLVRSSTS